VNLYRIQRNLTRQGYALNELVKIMNTGKYIVAGLSEALILVRVTADNAAIALSGGEDSDALTDMAMEEMRANMKKAADEITKRQDD
jgi:tRNA(Ile)-lysidine synthase TilS/MesJ